MITDLKRSDLTASNDAIFKSLMLENPDILRALLQRLLNYDIADIKVLNSELTKQQFMEKGKRLDAYLEMENQYIDIEVSTHYTKSTFTRNMIYAYSLCIRSVMVGDNYENSKSVRALNLIWNNKNEHLNRTLQPRQDEYGEIVDDMITFSEFYIDKYLEYYYNRDIEFIKENKYIIMLGLNVKELEELIKITEGDEIVVKYKEKLEQLINDEDFIPFITKEQDERMLREGLKIDYKNEGLEEGRKQGLEDGRREGSEREKEEIAKKLLNQNLDLNMISEVTGLDKVHLSSLL